MLSHKKLHKHSFLDFQPEISLLMPKFENSIIHKKFITTTTCSHIRNYIKQSFPDLQPEISLLMLKFENSMIHKKFITKLQDRTQKIQYHQK